METLPRSPRPRQSPQPRARTPKSKARGNGEGSVFKRSRKLKSGAVSTYWLGEVMLGYTTDGRRDIRRVTGATQHEARQRLDQLRAEMAPWATKADFQQDTVGDFLARWLAAAQPSLKPRTFSRYQEVIELHILPALGRTRLRALGPEQLQRLYSALADDLAPATIRKTHNVLHRALGQAVKWGAVSRNVAAAVDPPRVPRTEMRPPTLDQARKLLETAATAPDRLLPLWTLAIYTGARQGELLGLKWEDVDFARGTLQIRRTLERIEHAVPVFAEPKSATSRRLVALGPAAVDVLRVHKARQNEERLAAGGYYADYELVFATRAGTPLIRRNVLRDFKLLCDRAGLPGTFRFHDLRHCSATLMLLSGIHPKVASGRLGHATIGITQNLYSHLVEGLDEDAAQRIERAISGPGGAL